MSRDTLLTMVRGANPVPDPQTQPSDELATLVSAIERRTSMVKQQERHTDVRLIGGRPPMNRRRWTVAAAAAAFVAIIGIIGTVAVLTDEPATSTTEPPVASSTVAPASSTTTSPEKSPPETVAPTIAPVDQAVIDGAVAAYNVGDVDAVLGYFTPDTLYLSGVIDIQSGPQAVATWPDAVRGDLAWRAAVESSLSVESCSPDGSRVVCDIVSGSRLFDLRGGVPGRLVLEVADDHFTEFVLDETQGFVDQAFVPLQRWLRENHPEDFDTMFKQDIDAAAGQPHLTDESLVLWSERLDEYVWSRNLNADEKVTIDALVDAINGGEPDAFVGEFDCETVYATPILDRGPFNTPFCDWGDMPLQEAKWRVALENQWRLETCEREESSGVRCAIVQEGPFFDLRGGITGFLRVTVDGERLISYELEENWGSFFMVQVPFQRWLAENHPDDARIMLFNPPPESWPQVSDESIALWVLRIPEYLATLEG